MVEPAPEPEPELTPEEQEALRIKKLVSYFLGYQTGMQLAAYEEGPILASDLEAETFIAALKDGLISQLNPEIDEQKLQEAVLEFGQRVTLRTKELSQRNIEASAAFFKENAGKEGVITTPSGLQYKVLTPSKGKKYNALKDGVETEAYITYEGRMLNGVVFDAAEEPIKVALNGVIPGLSEALQLMPEGAVWEVYVPSELGYGEHGPGIVEASAAVIFRVKLHSLEPKRSGAGNPIEFTPEMIRQLEEAGLQSTY